jgi:hypothetical protein
MSTEYHLAIESQALKKSLGHFAARKIGFSPNPESWAETKPHWVANLRANC